MCSNECETALLSTAALDGSSVWAVQDSKRRKSIQYHPFYQFNWKKRLMERNGIPSNTPFPIQCHFEWISTFMDGIGRRISSGLDDRKTDFYPSQGAFVLGII